MNRQELDEYTLSNVDKMLFGLVGSYEMVDKWWESENKAFDMRTPREVWNNDQDGPERVYSYVGSFCYGR